MRSIAIVLLVLATAVSAFGGKCRVVILTGSNNHDWRSTTPVLKSILETSGEFDVDVVTEPEKLTKERLSRCDVLLSNWNGFGKKKPAPWSAALRSAYVGFVRNGGGHSLSGTENAASPALNHRDLRSPPTHPSPGIRRGYSIVSLGRLCRKMPRCLSL